MSVPLDRLYNFLDDYCNHDIVIYRFLPYGSKNYNDCTPLKNYTWDQAIRAPHALFYDQECIELSTFPRGAVAQGIKQPWFKTRTSVPYQFFNNIILVHSEKNSAVVQIAEDQGFIPVHWFSHGLIAREWFRYAEHDPTLKFGDFKHRFLVYNRAWSGSREYRIHFAQQLVQQDLLKDCLTTFGFVDSGQHYQQHKFQNSAWKVDTVLEEYFQPNTYESFASADYSASDYHNCGLEVILETVFDDTRIYLTEKVLRPIAVGKPFIIMAAPGALQYLRDYGFETFGKYINEDYDTITDPVQRMAAVLKEMKRLQNLSSEQFIKIMNQCSAIASRNQDRFFSAEFFNCVVNEYQQGINSAVTQCMNNVSTYYWDKWAARQANVPDVSDIMQSLGLLPNK